MWAVAAVLAPVGAAITLSFMTKYVSEEQVAIRWFLFLLSFLTITLSFLIAREVVVSSSSISASAADKIGDMLSWMFYIFGTLFALLLVFLMINVLLYSIELIRGRG